MYNPNPLMLGQQGIIRPIAGGVSPAPQILSVTGVAGKTADGGSGAPNYTDWYDDPAYPAPYHLDFPICDVGDTLIVAICANEGANHTIDGFTKIHDSGSHGSGTNDIRMNVFHRVIDGTEGIMLPIDEPGGYGWHYWGITYVRMRNVHPTSPVAAKNDAWLGSASGSMSVAQLDTLVDSTTPILFSGIRDEDNEQIVSGGEWVVRKHSTPTNFPNFGRNGQIMVAALEGEYQAEAGLTDAATVSWTHAASVPNCYSVIAFAPDPDYEPPTPYESVLDTFTAADNTQVTSRSPDDGPDWEAIGHGPAHTPNPAKTLIQGNQVQILENSLGVGMDVGITDYRIEMDWLPTTGVDQRFSIYVRRYGAGNQYMCNFRVDNQDFQIMEYNQGITTYRLQAEPYSWVGGNTYAIKVECVGKNLKVFINTVEVADITMTQNAQATIIGFIRNTSADDMRLDNFRMTAL